MFVSGELQKTFGLVKEQILILKVIVCTANKRFRRTKTAGLAKMYKATFMDLLTIFFIGGISIIYAYDECLPVKPTVVDIPWVR